MDSTNPKPLAVFSPHLLRFSRRQKRAWLKIVQQKQIQSSMGNKSSKKHYKIPPNAAKPDSPGKPEAEAQKNGIYLRWAVPRSDGNCPIIGYIVQHSELDDGSWHSSSPIPGNEALIHHLENGATYQFRVIAENIIGYSDPSVPSDPILQSTSLALPRFVTPLRSIYAIENEKVEFFVRVTGKPLPQLTWFLNGEEILSGPNMVLDQQNQRLTIKCSTSDMQGEIMCSASNEVGIESSSAELIVGSPPRILDDSSRETIFRVDELLRIKFTFSGRPKPDVSWFHNGNLLPEDSANIEVLGTSSSLKIPHASRADRGEYTIQIENNLGTDIGSVLVTVADKPIPPSSPTVVLLRDNSCMLEWEEGSDDGGCPVQCFIVEYFRAGWDVWLTGATSRSKVAKIRDLIPGSKYKFRIKAENLYGLSDASPESVELLIPELSSGLMTTVTEAEEETAEKTANEIQEFYVDKSKQTSSIVNISIPVSDTLVQTRRSPPIRERNFKPNLSLGIGEKEFPQRSIQPPKSLPREGLLFDHYQLGSRSPQRSPDSASAEDLDGRTRFTRKPWNQSHQQKDSPGNLSKTCSLPREMNTTNGDMALSNRCVSASSSSSHLIYEGSSGSSEDEDLDTSIVSSSLTVLKSGSLRIKTSSDQELRGSYDLLISNRSSRVASSKNSLNSEDFEYYNSIFGKTYQTEDYEIDDQQYEQQVQEAVPSSDAPEESEPAMAATSDTPEESESGPSWWSWWMYFLVPVSLALFFKYIFYANVLILFYVVYRLGMLFFE